MTRLSLGETGDEDKAKIDDTPVNLVEAESASEPEVTGESIKTYFPLYQYTILQFPSN